MDARGHIIVCGIDGSPASQRALEWAVAEARYRGCSLRAVTAWEWDGVEGMIAPATPEEAQGQAEIVQRRALIAALEGMMNPPEVERRLVRGRPSEALTTASLDAELLVVGGRGHSAMHDALVGSTSARVIRHASCPIVVLPDPQHVEASEHRRSRQRHRRSAEPPRAAPMF